MVDLRVNVKTTARSKTYCSTEHLGIHTGLVRLRTGWGGGLSLTHCRNVATHEG